MIRYNDFIAIDPFEFHDFGWTRTSPTSLTAHKAGLDFRIEKYSDGRFSLLAYDIHAGAFCSCRMCDLQIVLQEVWEWEMEFKPTFEGNFELAVAARLGAA